MSIEALAQGETAIAPADPSPTTIAGLLDAALGNPLLRVEVSRRDRTLYVFLTAPQIIELDPFLPRIRAVVTALGLADIAHLKVLDGTEKRLLNRWQYDFALTPAAPASSALPTPEHSAPTLAPATPAPVAAAQPSGTAVLPGKRPHALGRRRWLPLLAMAGLGFGFAGIAQWRYSQPFGSVPVERSGAIVADLTLPQPAAPALEPVVRGAALAPVEVATPVALTIKAVGDIIPGTDYQRYRLPDDWQYLFGGIQYHLGEADITFGNFESTFTEVPRSAKDTSRANTFAFRTPPWYASVLKEAGFDVLSVANNHSMDFSVQGFEDTIAHITAAGMQAVGRKGEILYVEARGQRVAFIGFSTYAEHNQVQDLEGAIALVQTAKSQADIVVVSFHAGKEGTDATVTRDQDELFYSENRGNVVRFSRTVIDHGADLVLGHGPHVPRALELYNNRLIAYSLGNFLGYRSLSTVGPLGTSLILQTDLDAQGNFVGGRIIPVALDRNGVPYLDDHFGGVVLVRQFTQRDFPNTPLEIDDLGYLRPR
nr:CapA family protein [Nodosilinea sp. TSF1-S3]